LGNTESGDGKRFKGRGAIQLTGRANYKKYGQLLGLDLENNPKLAESAEHGFRIAAAFWKTHGLNELADSGLFKSITKRINGGTNGLAERTEFYERALEYMK
ncbi:MAG: glycoside hydrolase family 19 protein, partial [Sediminibacterium sp.]